MGHSLIDIYSCHARCGSTRTGKKLSLFPPGYLPRSEPSWMRFINLLDLALDTSKPMRRILTFRIQPGQSTVVPPLVDCPILIALPNGIGVE